MSDWQVESGGSGGIKSIRLRGTELLAGDAGPQDEGSAPWQVTVGADRIWVKPARFELSQSMVWPFRYEPGMEVVFRGREVMPRRANATRKLKDAYTVRLAWPSTGVAVSIAWDEPRLPAAAVTRRSRPSRVELMIGPGTGRAVKAVSWWVETRDGSGARTVEVVDYNPAWPAVFRQEREELKEALGAQLVALEHGGSSAVPGLVAKPIIDMWAALRAPMRRRDLDAMAIIGYEYLGELGLADRDFFIKKSPHSFHLHCYPAGHPEWDRHLAFRDWLRTHPEGAAAYARLKRELADRFAADRLAYTEAKSDFIETALSG